MNSDLRTAEAITLPRAWMGLQTQNQDFGSLVRRRHPDLFPYE